MGVLLFLNLSTRQLKMKYTHTQFKNKARMSCTTDFVQYVIDQCSTAGEITVKKMFGDYGIYCNGKIVGLLCDDCLYIKPTEAGKKKLKTIDLRPPYPGAKNYFYIDDLEDHEVIAEIVKETYKELPEPKPRKKQ